MQCRHPLTVLLVTGLGFAETRLGIVAHEPAPVTVSFLVYPGTSGNPSLQYLIADAVVAPPERADARFSEAVVLLPRPYQANT